MRQPRILWGMTGSVATIRAPLLANALCAVGEVQAVATERAKHFLDPLPQAITLHTDHEEWSSWKKLGDPVLHIELRRWADLLVIAPATADILAKLAGGICDNLLLSVARAWDFSKPMLVAPAMNTRMWEHPITENHLHLLGSWGIRIIPPVEKKLACEDVGIGALAPPTHIVAAVEQALAGVVAEDH
ncbi:MAG: flavoprotein [Planctomycetota bacterium]